MMATYDLVCPFLNDNPQYAYGVEFGILYERMKTEEGIKDFFLLANQEQITLHANRSGWIIDKMEIWDKCWVWIEMHKSELAASDITE